MQRNTSVKPNLLRHSAVCCQYMGAPRHGTYPPEPDRCSIRCFETSSMYLLLQSIRTSMNGRFRYTDSRMTCNVSLRARLQFKAEEHQISPLLKIFLRREWISWILFVLLLCLSFISLVLFCDTNISGFFDIAKSWATFCCSGFLKMLRI